MRDRIPTYPGRVKLEPVSGQTNVYDMTRADEPTQEGTPLNKTSLLTDAVATAFGLGGSAVPNDVLDILKKSVLAQTMGKYTQTTIGALPTGTIMPFNVGGSSVNFIIVQQGKPSSAYDDSCDGTWFLMQDILGRANAGGGNEYAKSNTTKQLNGASFFDKLDQSLQAIIKDVKIPYFDGEGTSGSVKDGENGFLTKVFAPSVAETYGAYTSDAPVCGAKLAYFASGNTIAAKYNGSNTDYWTRDPLIGSSSEYFKITSSGSCTYYSASYNIGLRPAFILPSTLPVYTDDAGNVYTEQEYTTILTDVLGNEVNAGVRVEVGSYVGTGTYGESGKNSLAFGFNPKVLIIEPQYSLTASTTRGFAVLPLLQDDAILPWFSSDSGFGVSASSWRGSSTTWAAVRVTKTGNIVQWYNPSSAAEYQLNKANTVYDYIAIG